jgi:chemotaxis protein MotB
MSKKKHPEHVNHERWLVSYADFITLLFAFFVVLFASGQTDKRKQVRLAEAMQSAFQHDGIFDPHSKTPPLSDLSSANDNASAKPIALPLPTAFDTSPENLPFTEARIQKVAEHEATLYRLPADSITLRPTLEGLVVSLREAGFFASGSADVRPSSVDALRVLAAALPHQAMRVEGHTDNVPIHTVAFATNWELSTARAATITRLLLDAGSAEPTGISAAGYAEYHPIATNATEVGRAQNRRVDIVLLKPQSPPPVALKPVP